MLLIGFFVMPGRALAANTCIWSGANPGNWSNPVNWTSCGGTYPGASDSATINSGSVNLDISASVTNLTLTAGILTGTQNIAISDALDWTGGSMTGTGVTNLAAAGTMTTSAINNLTLNTRTFNNSGTVNWTSTGYLLFNSNATFNNLSGAAFNVLSTGTYLFFANAGSFNNQAGATFTKSTSSDLTVYNMDSFNNAGTMILTGSGVLSLYLSPTSTSTHSGAFQVNNANATLTFQAGTHNLNSGANISGAGHVIFAGGAENIHSIYNVSASTLVSGGSANFASDSTLTNLGTLSITAGILNLSTGKPHSMSTLTQTGGTLTGSDTITITSALDWTGGSMTGTGVTNLAAAGTMTTSAINNLTLDTRIFNNSGTVNWSSTGYLLFNSNATFNNLSGAVFNALSAGTYLFFANAGNLVNSGTLNLPNNSAIYNIQFTQTASGVINMPVSSTVAGAGFCQFITTSTVLNGTLNLTLSGGYLPALSDSFSLITYTTRTGAFSKISIPFLNPGRVWGPLYKSNHMEIDALHGIFMPVLAKP